MLSSLYYLFIDFLVQVIWCAIVDHINIRIGKDFINRAVNKGDAPFGSFLSGQFMVSIGAGFYFCKAGPADGFDMAGTDITHADNSGGEFFHALVLE